MSRGNSFGRHETVNNDVSTYGVLDIRGTLQKSGTTLTATGAEMNALAGVTAGTVTANKAVVVGANKNVDVLAIADLKIGSGAGTSVTSTAVELNKLASVTAGTVSASKAVVVGADKNVDVLAVADLKLGAGAGTSVTSTAAELNHADGKATQVSFVLGTEGSNARAVQMTFKDANGVAIAYPAVHRIYLSDAATGIGITADALTTTFAIATNGSILNVADVTGKMGTFQTSAAGLLGLTLTQTATKNYYLVVVLGDGSLAVSAIIAFD